MKKLNLRQYTVLGGTYAFHYVQTPAQSEKFVSRLFQTDGKFASQINEYHQLYINIAKSHSSCSTANITVPSVQ